jgi:hypothetical protein
VEMSHQAKNLRFPKAGEAAQEMIGGDDRRDFVLITQNTPVTQKISNVLSNLTVPVRGGVAEIGVISIFALD